MDVDDVLTETEVTDLTEAGQEAVDDAADNVSGRLADVLEAEADGSV